MTDRWAGMTEGRAGVMSDAPAALVLIARSGFGRGGDLE